MISEAAPVFPSAAAELSHPWERGAWKHGAVQQKEKAGREVCFAVQMGEMLEIGHCCDIGCSGILQFSHWVFVTKLARVYS